jgi:aryl-alcohol dehydrogenase-like predicted oxidoreductase
MQQRALGSSGIEVGEIGLGCMGMSFAYDAEHRDDHASVAAIHRAIEVGVTLFDTADVYGPHTNEVLVGRALREHRADVVIATKCGIVHSPDFNHGRNGSPEHVRASCDASLQRLGTDVIDLYQLHRVDPEVPIEETWGAFVGLVDAGKARAIGLSEVTLDELQRCHALHPVATVQSEFSLWTREWADDVLPWCRDNGVGFLPFSPLGRGFLTGTVDTTTIAADDYRARLPRFAADAAAHNEAIVDRVRAIALRYDATPAQVALAWLLTQGEQVVPIPGTKRAARIEENTAAADLVLSDDDVAALTALPAPVGTRY